MKKPKRYLVTSALPYANGPLHVGHLAGAYIPADIYVRYLRMRGKDVKFICGSDEHGAAITIRAKQMNMTPHDIIDKYHTLNKQSFEEMGMSFDIYHRTSAALHHETSSDFFQTLHKNGVFTVKTTHQYYDEEYQQFLADRYIKGECPKCAFEEAYGDQCENCGSDLSPTDLINPKSMLSGKPSVLKKTKHWYLPMQNYQDWVSDWIKKQQLNEKWKKHVLGQCHSWLRQGLQERAMTRDLDWGVKVPLAEAENKVLYVWLDAPIGYISATKALTDNWELYWKNEETKLVHFIGKDNIVFHCIIFPILLHAHGDYILPRNVPANQFMNLESVKLSTSRNHAVWIHEYLYEFPNKQDVLRYVLTANMPENKDSDFSWQDFKEKNNNDLVGLLGGFIHRTLTLIYSNFNGNLFSIEFIQEDYEENIRSVYEYINEFKKDLDKQIHCYEFRNALNTIMNLARFGNKFLTNSAPWKLAQTNKPLAAAILKTSLDLVLILSVYLEPFLPFTANRIRKYLRLDQMQIKKIMDNDFTIITEPITKPIHFFERIDEDLIQKQINKLRKPNEDKIVAKPIKEKISISLFKKIDIRVATIIQAKKVRKSSKLLELKIDLGSEQRNIVAGIAAQFDIEETIGKKVLILANLEKKLIQNIESQGMLLMIEDEKGKLCFTSIDGNVQNGATVR